MNAADRAHLVLAHAALVEAPVEVRAEHLERATGSVDVGAHARAQLLGVGARRAAPARRWPVIGQRERTALPKRTPSRSRRDP